jgi:predicted nucleic-acid-binding Zn-ribbon protein
MSIAPDKCPKCGNEDADQFEVVTETYFLKRTGPPHGQTLKGFRCPKCKHLMT